MADRVQEREILDLKSVNKLLPGEFIRSLSDLSRSWQLKKDMLGSLWFALVPWIWDCQKNEQIHSGSWAVCCLSWVAGEDIIIYWVGEPSTPKSDNQARSLAPRTIWSSIMNWKYPECPVFLPNNKPENTGPAISCLIILSCPVLVPALPFEPEKQENPKTFNWNALLLCDILALN